MVSALNSPRRIYCQIYCQIDVKKAKNCQKQLRLLTHAIGLQWKLNILF